MQEDLQKALGLSSQYGLSAAQGLQQLPGLTELLAQMASLKQLPYVGELGALQAALGYTPQYTKAGPGWGLLSGALGAAGGFLSGGTKPWIFGG